LRLIDKDALIEEIKEPCKDCTQMDCGCFLCDQCEITEEAKRVEDAPTVDAVQVVRCVDCKHYLDGGCGNVDSQSPSKKLMGVKPDWFCADGERRE